MLNVTLYFIKWRHLAKDNNPTFVIKSSLVSVLNFSFGFGLETTLGLVFGLKMGSWS